MTKKLNIYISIFIYLIAVIIFLPFTAYYFNSVDYAQYYSIALKYSTGNFSEAINLYWPPLFSWLLIPFIAVFKNPMLASQILNCLIGLFCILIFCRFDFVKLKFDLKTMPVFVALPICVLSFALMYSGPDLLFATLLMLIVQLFYNNIKANISMHKKTLITLTLLGSLLYMCKAMGFYLFVALVILFFILESKRNFKLLLSLLSYFILFSLPWILALSIKNNGFTIGLNGAYNFALITPENFDLNHPVLRHPFFANKLVPYTKQGFCAWEWPNESLTSTSSIFSFPKHYLGVVFNNFKSLYYIFVSRNFGILALLILLIVSVQRAFNIRKPYLFLLLAFAMPLSLYSLIFVHYRYLYIIVLASLLFFILAINHFSMSQNKWLSFLCNLILYSSIFLIVKRPIKEMFYKSEKDIATTIIIKDILQPLKTLHNTYNADEVFYNRLIETDNTQYKGKSFCGIRTNKDYSYRNFLEVAMFMDMKFYGEVEMNNATSNIVSKANPNYILDLNNGKWFEKF